MILCSFQGYWAKALGERYATENNMIHFFVAGNGDVHFGIAGKDLGVFFSGIDTRQPLWAMIDLYGNCTTLELTDVRSTLNNFSNHSSNTSTRPASRNGNVASQNSNLVSPVQPQQPQLRLPSPPPMIFPPVQPAPAANPLPPRRPVPPEASFAGLNLHTSTSSSSVVASTTDAASFPPLRHNHAVTFRPTTFHRNVGRHVQLEASAVVARRHEEEFAQGYVFLSQTVVLGERIVIQVLATEEAYIGSIAFGLTNCDPATLDVQNLPEDSDLLLDRSEYWVVSKDVANCPAVGDELSFQINRDGSVEFSKNGNSSSVFMHVDTSVPLWPFWDIYGHTSRIRLLGSTADPIPRPDPGRAAQSGNPTSASVSQSSTSDSLAQFHDFQHHSPLSECTICFEKGELLSTNRALISIKPRMNSGGNLFGSHFRY